VTCPEFRWWELGGLVVYASIEYWLGRTQRTKSGSVLELIFVALSMGLLGAWILWRKIRYGKQGNR
jgi:hypothetical protein